MSNNDKEKVLMNFKSDKQVERKFLKEGVETSIKIPDDVYIELKQVRDLISQYQQVVDALQVKANHLVDIAVDLEGYKAPEGFRHVVRVDMIQQKLDLSIQKTN